MIPGSDSVTAELINAENVNGLALMPDIVSIAAPHISLPDIIAAISAT